MERIYKNRLFEIATSSGLPLSRLKGRDDGDKFVIELLGAPTSFSFVQRSQYIFSWDVSGDEEITKYLPEKKYGGFAWVSGVFRSWLSYAVELYFTEESSPNFWNDLEIYRTFATALGVTEDDSRPFTNAEKVQVRASLLEFRQLVLENYDLAPSQSEFIKERLIYLSDAVDRLNHYDWKGLVLGVLFSIIITLTLDTQKGAMLFALFQQAFEAVTKLLTRGQ